MKVLTVLLLVLFSFTALGDCCNFIEVEDCKTELLSTDHAETDKHSTAEQEMCHCTLTCSPKILKSRATFITHVSNSYEMNFPLYIKHFKNHDPSLVFRPPIT